MPGYSDPGFDTLALHAGAAPDPATGARAVPIHLTTSFVFESSDHAASLFNLERAGHVYSRISNPTNAVLEQRMAALEGGIGAIATASGQAALHLAIATLMGAGSPHRGQHARCTAARRTCCTTRCAASASTPPSSNPATSTAGAPPCGPNTKLFFGETVGNPGLDVLDIPTVSRDRPRGRRAAAGGLHLHLALADASPSSMAPTWSTTRPPSSCRGHGTVIGGVRGRWRQLRLGRPALGGKFPELTEAYDGFHNMVFSEESTVGAFLLRARREGLRDFGACMSPHTAWLILQGIETLPLRMARHMSNTQKVVEFLAAQPLCRRVGHPMLDSHPSHALAQKLLPRGAGSVFSFDLKGNREQGKTFIETLKIFSHLANVGDCRSLVIHPASTTHFRMNDEALAGAGISQGTIRLSIGLEDPDDLIDDLKRALKAAEKAGA